MTGGVIGGALLISVVVIGCCKLRRRKRRKPNISANTGFYMSMYPHLTHLRVSVFVPSIFMAHFIFCFVSRVQTEFVKSTLLRTLYYRYKGRVAKVVKSKRGEMIWGFFLLVSQRKNKIFEYRSGTVNSNTVNSKFHLI